MPHGDSAHLTNGLAIYVYVAFSLKQANMLYVDCHIVCWSYQ